MENTQTQPPINEGIQAKESAENKRHGLSATLREYVGAKTGDPIGQREMLSRAVDVAMSGAKSVFADIKKIFPNEITTVNVDQSASEPEKYSDAVLVEQSNVLDGQKEKIDRMDQFVQSMQDLGEELIKDFAQTNPKDENSAQSLAEHAKSVAEYAKSVRDLVVQATRVITYQDIRASAVTLGDHGWMHLTQDFRDSVKIATGKLGRELSAKEKFMLGLAAAYHDVGYSVPGVSEPQRNNSGYYGSFDKGHPINSYVFVASEKAIFQKALGEEDTDSLLQIIANHENPERAERAGKHKTLSESFALADASAAFGIDKLPPVIVQVPEVLAYMNAIIMGESFSSIYEQMDEPKPTLEQAKADFQERVVLKLKNDAITAIDSRITHKDEADALKNSIDHFGPNSLKFLLGRMSAESASLSVDDQSRVVFSINAGFARKLEERGVVSKSVETSAKLTVKLFLEQAAIKLDNPLEAMLVSAVANNSLEGVNVEMLLSKGINIIVDESSVQIETESIVVKSNTREPITPENSSFYDKVFDNLSKANFSLASFIESYKAQAA